MRRHWKKYTLGDERTREFFAWWPVTIRHEHAAETRWLEKVRVLEKWTEFRAGEKFWPQRFVDESTSNAGERAPPTLTDEECETVDVAAHAVAQLYVGPKGVALSATLRTLLERLR